MEDEVRYHMLRPDEIVSKKKERAVEVFGDAGEASLVAIVLSPYNKP